MDPCGENVPVCQAAVEQDSNAPAFVDAMADQTRPNATAEWTTIDYWCPAHTDPAAATGPTAEDIRDEAVRLLPGSRVETTSPNTLVNIQTILWTDAGGTDDLGTVTVVDQPVQLHIAFDHAVWDFGDGHTETTSNPGTPYDPARHRCTTKLCPDYFGHVYRRSGPMTVTVRVAWDASYSLDGVNWAPVGSGPLLGPAGTVAVRVREARAQLIAD